MRRLVLIITAAIFAVSGLLVSPEGSSLRHVAQVLGTPSAAAQNAQGKRRSLFNILFGRKKAKKKAVKRKANRKKTVRRKSKRRTTARRSTTRTRKKKKSRSRTARVERPAKVNTSNRSSGVRKASLQKKKRVLKPAVIAPVFVEKSDSAKKILVVGDFFSSGLASGLEVAYAKNPQIVVVDKSNGLSGFVRNDIIDWPVQLPQIIQETKPDYIVAMLGSNDRQLMRHDGHKLKTMSPDWLAEYQRRVNALGNVLKTSNVPYTWVGLPPVRFKTMNKDFLEFNEIYGKSAVSRTGQFVDVWEGFSDEEDNYSRAGPDINGQIVLLRAKDGINLTKDGRRRLAFYVEGFINKALKTGPNSQVNASLAFDVESRLPPTETYNPARTGKSVVIRLDDPKVDGALSLAGETVRLDNASANPVALPVVAEKPRPDVQQQGRVDDYSWPPSNATQPATPALASSN